MRIRHWSLIALACGAAFCSAALAEPPVFGPAETVGSGQATATAAAVGGDGSLGVAWRTMDPDLTGSVFAAIRRPTTPSWTVRRLDTYRPGAQPRELRLAATPEGAMVAIWVRPSDGRLVAAIAGPGEPFGAPRRVAGLGRPLSVTLSLVRLATGRPLLVFADREPGQPMSLKALTFGLDGTPGRAHRVGLRGLVPRVAATPTGAIVSYLPHALSCTRRPRPYTCRPRPVRAAVLDGEGRVQGHSILVAQDAQQGVLRTGAPQIAAGLNGDAIVSWVSGTHRDSRGEVSSPAVAYTRRLRSRPLAATGAARRFPGYGGIGAGAPSVHITGEGRALAADVGMPNQAGLEGGVPVGSSATGGAWAGPTPLGPPSGWTTVPQLGPWGTTDAVAIYAGAANSPFDGGYAIRASWFAPRTGFAPSVVIGGPLITNDAGGLSLAGGGTAPLLVAWPASGGGVSVTAAQ